MMRIAIVGNSGSGKSTLARRVAARTGATHVELDAFFHQPNWTPQDPEVFRNQIAMRLGSLSDWVVDGNYVSHLDDLVRGSADTIVIYDLARATVMRQVIKRTLRRTIRREVLWNGNREPLTNLVRWDPKHNIVRWTWTQHDHYRSRNHEYAASRWSHADIVVVRRHADADRWLNSLPNRHEETNGSGF